MLTEHSSIVHKLMLTCHQRSCLGHVPTPLPCSHQPARPAVPMHQVFALRERLNEMKSEKGGVEYYKQVRLGVMLGQAAGMKQLVGRAEIVEAEAKCRCTAGVAQVPSFPNRRIIRDSASLASIGTYVASQSLLMHTESEWQHHQTGNIEHSTLTRVKLQALETVYAKANQAGAVRVHFLTADAQCTSACMSSTNAGACMHTHAHTHAHICTHTHTFSHTQRYARKQHTHAHAQRTRARAAGCVCFCVQLAHELQAGRARVEDELLVTGQLVTQLEGRLRATLERVDAAETAAHVCV